MSECYASKQSFAPRRTAYEYSRRTPALSLGRCQSVTVATGSGGAGQGSRQASKQGRPSHLHSWSPPSTTKEHACSMSDGPSCGRLERLLRAHQPTASRRLIVMDKGLACTDTTDATQRRIAALARVGCWLYQKQGATWRGGPWAAVSLRRASRVDELVVWEALTGVVSGPCLHGEPLCCHCTAAGIDCMSSLDSAVSETPRHGSANRHAGPAGGREVRQWTMAFCVCWGKLGMPWGNKVSWYWHGQALAVHTAGRKRWKRRDGQERAPCWTQIS